jgi:hypothetical protein
MARHYMNFATKVLQRKDLAGKFVQLLLRLRASVLFCQTHEPQYAGTFWTTVKLHETGHRFDHLRAVTLQLTTFTIQATKEEEQKESRRPKETIALHLGTNGFLPYSSNLLRDIVSD